jgi:hypothetical protein
MDWAKAIERNRDALIGIAASLFAMLGLAGGGTVGRIPRGLHRAVLRVLKPAESAVRRLIVIAARGLVVKPRAARPMPKGRITGKGGNRHPSFPLFDPPKRFASGRLSAAPRAEPRIHFFDFDPRVAALWSKPAPPSDGCVDAGPLCRRLQALKRALGDVPRQARRLARWRARRQTTPHLKFKLPLRPGPPPGHRRKPVHVVDEVLAECHGLAFDALRLDTS